MKKVCLISIFIIIILGIIGVSSYAATSTISLNGVSKLEPGVNSKVTVKIISIDTICGISGKIQSTNVTNLQVEAKNGWSVIYNQAEGNFNAYKAVGATEEDIFEISYTAGNEGTASIKLTDLTTSDINYQEERKSEITKTIEIKERLNISVSNYEVVNENTTKYIEKVSANTTIEELKEKIQTNGAIEVYKGENKITNEEQKLGTGMTVKITLNDQEETYEVVVTGDLTGEGEISISDLVKLARYNAKLDKTVSGTYLRAAEIVKDGNVGSISDLVKLARVLARLDNM